MAKPDLTRSGFRGPRSLNDLARMRARMKDFNKFAKVAQGSSGSNVTYSSGDGGGSSGGNGGGSASPTYNLVGDSTISENGSPYTYTVNTTNVSDGTTLYWRIVSVSTPDDFAAMSGSFTVTSNTGLFNISANQDTTTEGDESFDLQISSSSNYSNIVVTKGITVSDTSTGAPAATYSVSGVSSSVDEGSALTINVTTSNVSDGTTLYWTIGNNASDFSTTNGTVNINSNAGSFTVTPTADSTTEGSETFTVQIRTGSNSGTVVTTTSSITINDTSQTPTPTTLYLRVVNIGSYGSTNNKYEVGTTSSNYSSSYDLSFTKGTTYTFDVSDSSNTGHPLSFSTTDGGSAYSGVSNNSISAGTAGATVTLAVDSGYSGSEIYMYCTSHGTGMGSYYNPISVT